MLEQDINPQQKYINEWVDLQNGMIVHRYNLCLSSLVGYEVYEPTEIRLSYPFCKHSTITHHDDYGWLGLSTTRNLPDSFAALPAGSDERIAAVEHHYAELAEEAARLIRSAFPDDFGDQ